MNEKKVKIKDFNLALGVINNILIIDRENTVVFAGDDIKKDLFKTPQDLKKTVFDNFEHQEEQTLLKEKIEEVRQNKRTSILEFKRLGKDLFLFPGNYDRSEIIILSTRKQILQANRIAHDLRERVKELKCLYTISSEIESAKCLEDALGKSVEHLAEAFQFPECTRALIEVDGVFYGDKRCLEERSKNDLNRSIIVNGKEKGRVLVCYMEMEDFLEEEKNLVREIAIMIAEAIEKQEAELALEKQKKTLEQKNKKLLELTEEYSESRKNLEALFNAITDQIVVIEKDFSIEMSNKKAIGSAGKCYKKIFKAANSCEGCPAQTAFAIGAPASIEKHSGQRQYKLQAYPILNNKGEVDRVLEICRDITEEKHIKLQLLQSYKLASLGKLVAGVAHEINNPNTFIRGNIKIIEEAFKDILPILDRSVKKEPDLKIARLNYDIFKENIPILVEDMVSGTDRIKKIVDGLKNFARKDEGLLTDDVDINQLVKDNLRLTEKEVRKHARFNLRLAGKVPKFKGNSQKMEQVMMNLLINAAQAIENGGGEVFIETGYNEKNSEVIIKVGDNGKGMDEKTRRSIFDPFFTTKRDKGGTGLGLSISYGIIKEHKGRIEIETSPGVGTTFTIRIPTDPPAQE
ncbi:MAG: GHKL domain-containing protein [Candidatus Aminicenantes bacterium]|nr:GHKL domain-containing protein [Candidatus Aminicenantes bacterium]